MTGPLFPRTRGKPSRYHPGWQLFRPAPSPGTYALRLRCASRLCRPLVRPVTGAPVAPYFVPVSRHPMRASRPFSSALLGRESRDQPLRSLTADELLLWKRRCVRTLSSSSHVRESIPQPTLPVGKSRRLHHEKGKARRAAGRAASSPGRSDSGVRPNV